MYKWYFFVVISPTRITDYFMDVLNDVTCIMYSLTIRITILPYVLSYLRYSVMLIFLNFAR